MIYIQDVTNTPSGPIKPGITSDNVIAQIYGNSVQNGTPSPTNPVEIQSVGDKTKNLLPFPYKTTTKTQNGISLTVNDDGSILLNGTATAGTTFYLYQNLTALPDGIKVGDTVTISKNVNDEDQHKSVYFIFNYYNSASSMQTGIQATNTTSFKKVITDEWIGAGIYIHVVSGKTLNNFIMKPMIEVGSVATEYEPYNKYKIPITVSNGSTSKTTNIYLDEPLRKIGDYADYIDLENRKVVRNVGEYVITGNENWVQYSSGYKFYLLSVIPTKYETNISCFCNKYQGQLSGDGATYSGGNAWVQSTATYERFYIADDNYQSKNDFSNYLKEQYSSGNPVIVNYVSANSTIETVSVPEIPELSGSVTYSIGTSVQPSAINYGTRN